jgi:hypothetical protein
MKNQFLFTSWLMAVALLAGPAVANELLNRSSGIAVTQSPAGSAMAAKRGNAQGPLAQAALDAGVRTCKPLADQVNRYLLGENVSTGMVFTSPQNANGRIFSSAIEIESRQGVTYASTSYAPYGDTGCGVAYDAVTYWKESCTQVASTVLKDLRIMGTLGNTIAVLDGGPAMRMFLMPAGTGCIQIKKEIVY